MVSTEVLLAHWSKCSTLRLQPGLCIEELEKFSRKYGVVLPDDFSDLYMHVNGFSRWEGYQDCEGFSFWPLQDVVPVAECDGLSTTKCDRRLFVFADYLDACWWYAIRLEAQPCRNEVHIVGLANGMSQRIAGDFSEFVQLYVADSSFLYPPK